jgi:hypothetical protein
LPDLGGYELDQPYNRIISLGVWAPFPSAVNVAGVRGAPPRRAVADDPRDGRRLQQASTARLPGEEDALIYCGVVALTAP